MAGNASTHENCETAMPKRVFTERQRRELATPLPDRIRDHIRAGRPSEALRLCEEMEASRIHLHDFFAASCTVLWSWIGERLGEEAVEGMFRYVFEQSARRQMFDVGGTSLGIPAHVGAAFLAKYGWRAHSCFGAGDPPGRFRVTEDDEKFTFHLDPCGSGARLWRTGWYAPGRGGRVSTKARPWTYNRAGFPYYCIHCSFLNEILPYEAFGGILWPVDPPKGPDAVCRWHLYKDPNRIPRRYYERFGLEKKRLPSRRVRRRYCTDAQLAEMVRPRTDLLREAIDGRRLRAAAALCRDVKDEFLFLHDLYVHMLVATLTFLADRAGEEALGEALEHQYARCVRAQLVEPLGPMPPAETAAFLAQRVFGVDACNGTGSPRAAFSMTEEDADFVYLLDPCGSGGRLLRGGAYAPRTRWRRWREDGRSALVRRAARLLPDPVIERAMDVAGLSLMSQKPHGQGRTRRAYPWSFDRAGVPYYCCQCGMLHRTLGARCLDIRPPREPRAPCVWRVRKHR